MPDFSRRSIILGTAGIAAAGAGVTAAAGLQGSVEGQADVQAEQALTVTNVSVQGSDQDAKFTRKSDDNTSFQAAVELNNGDKVTFQYKLTNSAADPLDVQITVNSPDPIDIHAKHNDSGGFNGGTDLDPDDESSGTAVQTGEGKFVASIAGGKEEVFAIFAELDDTADPGSYDIGAAINPLSTD